MSIIIKISDVVAYSDKKHRKTVKIMMQHMAKVKGPDSYSNYAPHLGFDDGSPYSAANRKHVGAASYQIYLYCVEEYGGLLPWLNMLIVLKDLGIPGSGMQNWYEDEFNTLNGYVEFCELHARLAELVLQKGLVKIIP